MPLPAGMRTTRLEAGPWTLNVSPTFPPATGKITFRASTWLVWAATGQPFAAVSFDIPLVAGGLFVDLPSTDQDGFVDGEGRPVTSWAWETTVTLDATGAMPLKLVQLPQDVEKVDLDTLGSAVAGLVTIARPDVRSVVGLTGHVTAEQLADALTAAGYGGGAPGGTGPATLVWRGEWAAGTVYAVHELVSYQGSSYRVTRAHTSTATFDSTAFAVVAARGAQGDKGQTGDRGLQGLQGDRGLQGDKGERGSDGTNGLNGQTGPAGRGFTPRGAWTVGMSLAVDDLVTASGSVFRVRAAHVVQAGAAVPTPTTPGANLELWAAQGARGSDGATGPQGDPGDDLLYLLIAYDATDYAAQLAAAPEGALVGVVGPEQQEA